MTAGGQPNRDDSVISGFGDEWTRFDQSNLSVAERQQVFDAYFSVFPWESLPPSAVGADIGCGSGRWAVLVAPRVGELHCIDPSAAALDVARRNLQDHPGVTFHCAGVDDLPLPARSLDFAYSLGVLHHVPDTAAGIQASVRLIKPGGVFLVYLYYAFDGRSRWFRALWHASDVIRRVVSRAPGGVRWAASQVAAVAVYLPLSRIARLGERFGRDVDSWPLSFYRDRSMYVMRTDALDRFGTRLEQRFTRAEIAAMLASAGLVDVRFRERSPYWVACGRVAVDAT